MNGFLGRFGYSAGFAGRQRKTFGKKARPNWQPPTSAAPPHMNTLREMEFLDMIEVKNLTKKYGSHLAVDDISFSVNDGDYRFVWAIPQAEIDANPNMRQNPGYTNSNSNN